MASVVRLLYFTGCVEVAEEGPSGVGCAKQRKMSILETSFYNSEAFHDLTYLLDSPEPSLPLSIILNHITGIFHATYSAACLKSTVKKHFFRALFFHPAPCHKTSYLLCLSVLHTAIYCIWLCL